MADANIFQQFLNKVGRGYGQLDKNVFGGLLPGGAATPIGTGLQNYVVPKEQKIFVKTPSSTERHTASLLDAAAGAIANAQPFVQKTIQSTPEPVQDAIASGLNVLPFSVNLFSRYYTGIGNKNLVVPQSATAGMGEALDRISKFKPQQINALQFEIETTTNMLNKARQGNSVNALGIQRLNDSLAEAKSRLNRVQQGDIPFMTMSASDQNPLTSPATSFGNLWFQPKGTGYQATDKYDFVYANADQIQPRGPFPGGAAISPSQSMSLTAAEYPGITAAVASPLTQFGRAIVSKLPDKSFTYQINVP